jgi:hypothetical protein
MAVVGLDRSLPWYFGVAVFVIWAALIVALGYLVRRRMRAWAERRAMGRRAGRRPPLAPDDRSIGPGTDVEPW